jgi:hypothetical protein
MQTPAWNKGKFVQLQQVPERSLQQPGSSNVLIVTIGLTNVFLVL